MLAKYCTKTMGAIVALVTTAALAAPPVYLKTDRFVTATEKNAVKTMRMRVGYKGDVAAKELAQKIFRGANANEAISLVDDKSNHLLYVSKADPSAHFRIDKTTGDFSLTRGLKNYLNDQATANLPDKEKAVELAKRHLAELGLMPADERQMVVRHVGGMRQADVDQNGKVYERDKLVTVHFGRQIDGIDVGGPGSKIVVELGANGELVGVHRRWVEVAEEKRSQADLHGREDVTNAIKAKLQRDGAQAKRIDAIGPDFGYFDDGKGNIEPAYFYTADVVYDSTDQADRTQALTEKHHGAVPALKNSRADFEQLAKARLPPGKSAAVAKDQPSRKDQ